ncbi:MAG: hypothetical protein GAK30_00117 [Paracidovorax wautersii]|uniref:DUF945 domain-containing protein n=1 Tax=Paracidovorax wautersii TaxID=1177982 RepID=A0A7V8JRZ9_9BURK|nr:MAG: hypothetical protein GAK30_00117 [Paracidovorax wautersii]
MKKSAVLTLSAVAAAALAYAGGTWWAGERAQAIYEQQVAQLQQRYPGLAVLDHQYQRGFWHSSSTLVLQYGRPDSTAGDTTDNAADPAGTAQESEPETGDPAQADAHANPDTEGEEQEDPQAASADDGDEEEVATPLYFTVVLNDRITHGPITSLRSVGAASVNSTLTLDARSTPEIAATLAGKTLATARTDVDFSGDFSSAFQGPELSWNTPAGDAIHWLGLQGTLASTGGADKLSYELTAPGLQVDNADDGMHVGFSGLSLRGIDKAMNALWALSGRDEGQIGTISIKADETADDAKPFELALQNVQFQQTNKTSGDLLDGMLQVTGTGTAGGLPINGFELRTSLTRLHAPTYLRMAEQVAGLSSDDAEGAAAVMRSHLSALLAYNPEYALDKFSLDIDGEHGEASYRLSMPGVTPEEQEVPLSLLAVSRLQLEASANLPVSWLEWIARESALDDGGNLTPAGAKVLLDELVHQRLVLRDGPHRIKTQVHYEKGRLEVNGKPLRGGLGALGNL